MPNSVPNKRFIWLAAAFLGALVPATAYANVGVPMIAPSLIGMLICIIPVILMESLILRWRMRIDFRRSLKASSLAGVRMGSGNDT